MGGYNILAYSYINQISMLELLLLLLFSDSTCNVVKNLFTSCYEDIYAILDGSHSSISEYLLYLRCAEDMQTFI